MRPGPATTSAPDRLARKSKGCPSGSPTDGSAGSPTPRTRRARVARCSPRGVHRGDTLAIVATHRVCASRRRPPTVSERTPHEEGRADGPSARTAPGWPSAQPSTPPMATSARHRKRDRPAPPHLRMESRSDNGTERVRQDDCQLQRCAAATEGNLGGEQAQGGQAVEHLQQCTTVRTSSRSKASRDSLLSIRSRTRFWKRMRRRDRGSAGGEVRGGNERGDALRLRRGGVLRGVRTRCGEPAVPRVRQRTTPAMATFAGPAPREQQAKRVEPHDWQRDATSPRLIRWRKPARP